eukprot:scaffold1708_cov322-Pavlova_lutheri.AAC.19
MSEMPLTPCRRTSSARVKASVIGMLLSTVESKRSLGMTIKVSTFSSKTRIASWACKALRLPSNVKGVVTIPTVKIPAALATPATTGAAPLPVPPPIPAVTNTMSDPSITFSMASRDSLAARNPTSGFPPAPRPLVKPAPICRR